MADEQYRWLDRGTAERLLRGEPLDAVEPRARNEAERLAETLRELAATSAPTCSESPGEAAALAAFRAARDDGRPPLRTDGTAPSADVGDAGVIQLGAASGTPGRPRWGRRVRLGLAAAVTVGMAGGVAVAAGSGVISTSFPGIGPERPDSSVSAADTPGPVRSTPSAPASDGTGGTAGADGGATAPPVPAPARGTTGSGLPRARESGTPVRGDASWRTVTDACRDVRAGRRLDAERRRTLEGAAGSAGRVTTYCRTVLSGSGSGNGEEGSGGTASGSAGTEGGGGDSAAGGDAGGGDGKGGRGDDEDRGSSGDRGHRDAATSGGSGGSAGRDGHGSAGAGGGNGEGGRGHGRRSG
ncbi:hypothetical protein ACL02U_10455 [Streptomyces sp. MS06]|uniref:hypothetical protein n=1 Tax=Streptomyces sp. MS06 TaxID=3385974 RepID=UPI0039A276A4